MKLTRRRLLILATPVTMVIAAIAAYDWYYKRYLWPQRIQQELLGGSLAPPARDGATGRRTGQA